MKTRELLMMPLIIIVLSILIYLIGDYIKHPFCKCLFPQSNSNYEIIKIYFTSFLLIYLGGLLIETDNIDNYLLSRVLSLSVIIIINYFLYRMLSKYGHLGLIITMVISVYLGQYLSYKIQMLKINNSDILAIILQTIIALLISYITFYAINVLI